MKRAFLFLAAWLGPMGCGHPTSGTPPDAAGNCQASTADVANEGWVHVPVGTDVKYKANPPASGPHYGNNWAHEGVHTEAVPREYWVHNVEHGGVILLYRPDIAADQVAAMTDLFTTLAPDPLCPSPRKVMTPDPLIETPVAVVAANVVLKANCVDRDAIFAFFQQHIGQGPEQICTDGSIQ